MAVLVRVAIARLYRAGGGCRPRAASSGVEAIEQLAASLRERLVERAREQPDERPVAEQVRALVESEARPLPEPERALLAERVLRLATGLGPLEPLLADPRVDEVM